MCEDCREATDWTATVTLLTGPNGATIATQNFTVSLPNGNSSVLITIPNNGYRGEWCRVKLANATAAGVGRIEALELFFLTRADFRGPRAT